MSLLGKFFDGKEKSGCCNMEIVEEPKKKGGCCDMEIVEEPEESCCCGTDAKSIEHVSDVV